MNTVDIIVSKKNGNILTREEIEHMVMGYTDGNVPDYQMAAFLMAICLNGMSKEETIAMTQIMKVSGDVVDLSDIKGRKVDKHSTGGVGDKTTLIVGPIAAACGIPVAKMSGRGLGFTGGTIDKLESIPGYKTSIEEETFINLVNRQGISVIGQTGHIAPADKKIYALRDVTGTVGSLSLITSSVMSKKLAAGADAIVLDVKCGKGAFMKDMDEARELASLMVEIGKADGKDIIAVITDMDQPLGCAVGNGMEVQEAIDVLKGRGPEDIKELSVHLAGYMVYMGNKASSMEEGVEKARKALEAGRALDKFKELITGQGGDPAITDNPKLLPQSSNKMELLAWEDGYVSKIDAMGIGIASQHVGAGREKKEDDIDLSAGIYLHEKIGNRVRKGQLLVSMYGNDRQKVERALEEVKCAVAISGEKPEIPELIKEIIK